MRSPRFAIFLSFYAAALLPIHAQTSDRSASSIGLAYWNDDFLFRDRINDALGSDLIPGTDDLHTAGFWFRLGLIGPSEPTCALVRFDILTSRDRNDRIDVLEIRWQRRIERPWGYMDYAFGGLIAGDLGGQAIQNAYHALTGIDRVDLPYTSSVLAGARVLGHIEIDIHRSKTTSLLLGCTGALAIPVGPELLASILALEIHPQPAAWLRASLEGGYAARGSRGSGLSPFFSSGFLILQTVEVEVASEHWMKLWHTSNIHGGGQDHYGVSYATEPHRVIEAMW